MLNGKVDMPMMANMNGQDMLMPMVKISLPIYRKKINSERRSAQLLKQSTQSGILRQRDVLRSEYLSIGQRVEEVMRKLALYDKEVRILDNTLQLMQREYVSATTTLTDILSTTREQIDYALKKAEARAQYNTLVAEYEKMISRHDFAERMVVK
jgi:outer membrane protein TolC